MKELDTPRREETHKDLDTLIDHEPIDPKEISVPENTPKKIVDHTIVLKSKSLENRKKSSHLKNKRKKWRWQEISPLEDEPYMIENYGIVSYHRYYKKNT